MCIRDRGYTSIYMNDIQLYGYNGANHLLANNHEINENTAQTSCELAEQAKGRCIYYNASEEGLMYMAKQIKDSLTMKPVGILRASIKLSYLKKMTITARDSLAAHIFLLDNDKNVLIESAENDACLLYTSYRRSYLSDCKVYSCHNTECYYIVSKSLTYRKHDRNEDVHSGVCIDEASCDQEDDIYDQQEGKLIVCDASK